NGLLFPGWRVPMDCLNNKIDDFPQPPILAGLLEEPMRQTCQRNKYPRHQVRFPARLAREASLLRSCSNTYSQHTERPSYCKSALLFYLHFQEVSSVFLRYFNQHTERKNWSYDLAMKKHEIMTFAENQMELEIMIASKIRQTQEGRVDKHGKAGMTVKNEDNQKSNVCNSH
ncbi:hypothetical protein STEG23_018231, partial [Scotinomys teguina]